MKRTKAIGAAAQSATVIKDLEVIEDYGQLEVSAGEIGIDETPWKGRYESCRKSNLSEWRIQATRHG